MVRTLISHQFARYTFASAIALCVDYGSYWVIAETTNLATPTAAATGYSIGLIAAYFLIAGPVFKDGWLRKKKILESVLFLVSGLLGGMLTYAIVSIYTKLFGDSLHAPKLFAVAFSFVAVFIFRRVVVFKKSV